MSPTHRWRVLWTAIAAGLTVLDLKREHNDTTAGRDYINGTTFSCYLRWLVSVIPGGSRVFDVGLSAFHWWFRGHVLEYPSAPAFYASTD